MKRNVLALSIAAMVGGLGLAGGASAAVFNVPNAHVTNPTTARVLQVNTDGLGHILVVPYYTAQGDNATLLNVVNTDTVNGKVLKVRFRGAANSDDVLDFQVLMSPGDVWSANVSKGSDGKARLATTDKTCTIPSQLKDAGLAGVPFITDRLQGAAAAGTLEGYVEIFNMANVPPNAVNAGGLTFAATANPLFTAIKHVSGVAPCTAATIDLLKTDPTSLDNAYAKGLAAPTGGLLGNWIIVNVPRADAYSGSMQAIEARVSTGGASGAGNIVFFPQVDEAALSPNTHTADPTLRTTLVYSAGTGTAAPTAYVPAAPNTLPVVIAKQYDLPDLSTPYIEDAADVEIGTIAQAAAVTTSLQVTSVTNEFLTGSGIGAATDWTFSQPTRRYSVAMDYRPTTPVRIFSDLSPAAAGPDWYTDGNTLVSNNQVCVTGASISTAVRDREETSATTGFVFSPGSTPAFQLCGEVAVLSVNAGGVSTPSVLGSTVARANAEWGYAAGWTRLGITGAAGGTGLPVIGTAFTRAASGSSFFGAEFDHRVTRP
jgi:hypothetical protein